MLIWVITLVAEVQPNEINEDRKDGQVQFPLIYDTAITHLPSPGREVSQAGLKITLQKMMTLYFQSSSFHFRSAGMRVMLCHPRPELWGVEHALCNYVLSQTTQWFEMNYFWRNQKGLNHHLACSTCFL